MDKGKNSIDSLAINDGEICPDCGRVHSGMLRDCLIGEGAVERLPELVKKYGGERAYVLCDRETYAAAGETACSFLSSAGIKYDLHVIPRTHPKPDELTVGEAFMHLDRRDDIVVGVGGGVINDTCKLIAAAMNAPYIIVGTAPSMDGFASATSSMDRGGLKLSLFSKCPEAVIGDTNILAAAPTRLIVSGIGDMLAKYVSIAEWRISNIINDEYYCPRIADTVEESLAWVTANAQSAVRGDKTAVSAVMEGLVLSGLCMNYAGVSRPASGMEHYISHIADMRALEFGTPSDLHGIQCGIATLRVIREYKKFARETIDRSAAIRYAREFDLDGWYSHLRSSLGRAAEPLIELDRRERKYDTAKHAARLERIIERLDDIRAVIDSLPDPDLLENFMNKIAHPTSPEEIGITREEYDDAFMMAKDIRDKYVLGRLLWDTGRL